MATVFEADKIIVLSNGKVVEEGKHEELMENHLQYYQQLKQQFPMLADLH